MNKIISKRQLSDNVFQMELEAPLIAAERKAGQFIILMIDEKLGERIPLTIADASTEKGTITIIFQTVGATTMKLSKFNAGDALPAVLGPLGKPTNMEGLKRVAVVGGGVGCAIAYPVAKGMFEHGIEVDMIAGFRSKDIVILEDEMRAGCTNLHICTDDGSYGFKGFTTDKLKELIESGREYDEVVAIGPTVMMKFTCVATKPYGIKTVVSLNPIMVDGTGMCGCCSSR